MGADATNNILITFDADPSGLAPGVEGLQQLGKVDQNLADSFNKTNDSLKQRQKVISDNNSAVQSYVQTLQNATKATVGAFGGNALGDFSKQITSVVTNTKTLQTFLAGIKQNLQSFKPGTDDWKQLNTVIQQGEALLKTYGTTVTTTATKSGNLLTQLRQMRFEMQALDQAGLADTQAFKDLSEQAAELESGIQRTQTRVHALASETVNIDALREGVEALSAGFEIGAGVSALFGDKNEDLEKTLIKLNAVMAIANGIQQIQNAIREQSILKIKLEGIQEAFLNFIRTGSFKAIKQNVAATVEDIETKNADTVATVELGVATTAAGTAMQFFRAALLATGIGAIVVALGFLISELGDFISNTKAAEKAQRDFNDAIENAGELLDADLEGIQNTNDKIIASMKARNASNNDIAKQELSTLQLLQKKRQESLDTLTAQLNHENFVRNQTTENYEKLTEKQLALQGAVAKGSTEIIQKQSDIQVQAFQDGLKSQKAFADARVVIESKYNDKLKELLDANIQAAKTEASTELQNANLTAGERLLIEANLQKKIHDLQVAYQVQVLQQQKNTSDAQVSLAADGSKKQLDAQLASLKIQHDIEIVQAQDDASKKEKIDADYFKNRLDLLKKFSLQVAQQAQQQHISIIDTHILDLQLQGFKDTDAAIIEAKKDLIDQQAALDVLSLGITQADEAKRLEIYTKAAEQKKELDRQVAQAQINETLAEQQRSLDIQKQSLQDVGNSIGSFGSARKALDDANLKNALDNIQAQKDAQVELFKNGIIGFTEFYNKIKELDDASTQARIANIEAAAQRQISEEQFATDAISQLVIQLENNRIQSLENEGTANQDLLNKKIISQDEYNKRQRQLAKEESAIKKQQAIFQTVIDAANKIFAIEASASAARAAGAARQAAGDPTGLATGLAMSAIAMAQIPIVIGEEALSLALISAQKFKSGKVKIDGPGTETSDSIFAMLSKNESVINAEATRKYEPALRAINELKFEDYLVKTFPQFTVPEMLDVPEWAMHQTFSSNIDYDKLGEAFAKHVGKIADMPQTGFNWDEDGVHKWIKKRDELNIYLNKRFGYIP